MMTRVLYVTNFMGLGEGLVWIATYVDRVAPSHLRASASDAATETDMNHKHGKLIFLCP